MINVNRVTGGQISMARVAGGQIRIRMARVAGGQIRSYGWVNRVNASSRGSVRHAYVGHEIVHRHGCFAALRGPNARNAERGHSKR